MFCCQLEHDLLERGSRTTFVGAAGHIVHSEDKNALIVSCISGRSCLFWLFSSFSLREIFFGPIINLTFESGLKATASCSWLHPVKEQKLVIIGDKGMAVFDDTLDWENKLAVYKHYIDKSQVPPILQKAEVKFIQVEQLEPLRQECKYFLDLIEGHAPVKTGGEEGRAVLKVLTEASIQMKKIEGSVSA